MEPTPAEILNAIEYHLDRGRTSSALDDVFRRLSDLLLTQKNYALANRILQEAMTRDMPLAVFLAFLTVTKRHKKALPSRQALYDHTHELATAIGGAAKAKAALVGLD